MRFKYIFSHPWNIAPNYIPICSITSVVAVNLLQWYAVCSWRCCMILTIILRETYSLIPVWRYSKACYETIIWWIWAYALGCVVSKFPASQVYRPTHHWWIRTIVKSNPCVLWCCCHSKRAWIFRLLLPILWFRLQRDRPCLQELLDAKWLVFGPVFGVCWAHPTRLRGKFSNSASPTIYFSQLLSWIGSTMKHHHIYPHMLFDRHAFHDTNLTWALYVFIVLLTAVYLLCLDLGFLINLFRLGTSKPLFS